MNPLKSLACAGLGLLFTSPLAASASEGARFLPFMAPQLEAARYSEANEEFAWVGWIGARVDLVQKGKWAAFFNPNVETILGHRVRSFEAVQANYSLEVGFRREIFGGQLSPFFHHMSRHVQDRAKLQAVDWNFLGLRFESPLPQHWKRRGDYLASFGMATLSSGVRYNWEARASIDLDVAAWGNRALFARVDLRQVGASRSEGFPRGPFTDVRAEAGFRRFQESSQFALFVAYEHRNDARVAEALVIDRALFGFRIRGQKGSASTTPVP